MSAGCQLELMQVMKCVIFGYLRGALLVVAKGTELAICLLDGRKTVAMRERPTAIPVSSRIG